MEDENGSILRVVSGQKFLYGDNELSLVLPELQDAVDEQDSNDSSQIELQVSGDEETAHAIIAAAREQGGAFIKVESGEMYRVQSVQSKTEAAPATTPLDNSIVVHVDGQFRCRLCEKNAPEGSQVMVGDAEQTMQHVKEAHSARVYICRHCACVLRRRAEYLAHVGECLTVPHVYICTPVHLPPLRMRAAAPRGVPRARRTSRTSVSVSLYLTSTSVHLFICTSAATARRAEYLAHVGECLTVPHVYICTSVHLYICRHCACVLRRRAEYLAHVGECLTVPHVYICTSVHLPPLHAAWSTSRTSVSVSLYLTSTSVHLYICRHCACVLRRRAEYLAHVGECLTVPHVYICTPVHLPPLHAAWSTSRTSVSVSLYLTSTSVHLYICRHCTPRGVPRARR
ncbi:unnamed protein product [Euphydryas editha]|uniref:Uncharacterized protein n=1 Tax=Euphydryas editha TaxID=104508 RepID=A0AAU9UP33_EUPED|nr:unnamed protein product [Euphydryas editha]